MIAIKDRLARYEISVAEWYIEREAYVAAINRSKLVLNNYPDTSSVEAALHIMINAYDELGLVEPKKNAEYVLQLNFPDTGEIKLSDTWSFLDW
jgi:outer membrane protein assembly factor BamD